MAKRVGFEDPEDDGPDEDSGELNEAQQEVRAFANEKRRQKKQRRQEVRAHLCCVAWSLTRVKDVDEEAVAAPAEEDDDGDADVMLERRADGSKRIVGVDGEEKALYRKTDLAELEREMGTKLEPFNLKAEMEEGHFDAEGHYIERGFGQSDAWLQEMDLANANVIGGPRSRFVKPLQLDDEQQREEEQPQKPASVAELAAWGGQLHALLRDDEETVAGALKRLAQERREARKRVPHKKTAGGDPQFAKPVARQRDEDGEGGGGERDAFDRASTLADRLQNAGLQQPVFGMRRSDLLQWRRGAKVFEYVIRGGGTDGGDSEIFGPFSGDAINAWKQQGYFASGQVELRIKIGPNRGVFRPAAAFDVDKELAAL